MFYDGHVRDGVVIVDGQPILPDGAKVKVEVVAPAESACKSIPSLYDQLAPFIGVAKDLPPDLAQNHDHYLHGQAKK